jgi:hypothetical protein
MPKVRCSVDSCQFWGSGQVCNAAEIWVRNDISGDPDQFSEHFINASNRAEFARDFGEKAGERGIVGNQAIGSARTSPQTCCDTMRPKSIRR